MNLRFSLLGLIGFTTFAGVASAALAQASFFWTSVVVSSTAALLAWQMLRAILCAGEHRAAAVGWLVFAIGYLVLVQSPWLSNHVGPNLLTSRGLVEAQVEWHNLPVNPVEGQPTPLVNWVGRVNVNGLPQFDTTGSTLWIDSGWVTYPADSGLVANGVNGQQFHLAGHWLCAWIAGWVGAVIAVQLQRYQATRRLT